MSNVGVISQETALSYCLTGPILRSTGVDYDVRKAFPYLVYDRMDFEVPVAATATITIASSAACVRSSRA